MSDTTISIGVQAYDWVGVATRFVLFTGKAQLAERLQDHTGPGQGGGNRAGAAGSNHRLR